MRRPRRLAVIFDAVEERWPSMDLVAEMLLVHLQKEHSDRYQALAVRPKFFGLFGAMRGLDRHIAWNADRLLTRFFTYPTQLAFVHRHHDLFHIADHTYAQLAHVLPGDRTGVYCHDLDAFACLLQPKESVSAWRKVMARRQLSGLQKASLIFHSTEQVRRDMESAALVDPGKLVHAPYGVAWEYFSADGVSELPPGALPARPFLFHVGSNMQRKRIDVLLRVFASVRTKLPDLVLVQQGAKLGPEQKRLVSDLGIGDALVQPPPLSRAALAALYRRAELVLLTSEREGFGLPIVEALASGAAVVASDIPPFREIGDDAITYCPVGDVERWTETVLGLIERPEQRPPGQLRRAVAERHTWTRHAEIIANAYDRLAGSLPERA